MSDYLKKENEVNKEYDVSVIIPIYNSEEYIEQGIQSVLNQSNIEVELIL